jgi:AcrR family transcriptional regulator
VFWSRQLVKSECSFYFEGMPRVTDEHLAARRRQILDAARRCFIRKGFHQSSMTDVLAEAELSAGAVYRYFPSKNAIVAAIAEEALTQGLAELEEVLSQDPLPALDDVLGRVFTGVSALAGPDGPARIGLQVWGEAMHDEALREIMVGILTRIRGMFTELARRLKADGQLPADADPFQAGAALFALVPGFMLQRLVLDDLKPEAMQAGLRALVTSPRAGSTAPIGGAAP